MDKTELLDGVRELARDSSLSRAELLKAYESAASETGEEQEPGFFASLSFFDLLYYIGGLLVVCGLGVLIHFAWEGLGATARIFLTLGLALLSLAAALVCENFRNYAGLALGLHWIAGPLLPTGIFVTLNQLGGSAEEITVSTGVSGLLFLTYLAVLYVSRLNVVLFFTTIFGTWFYYSAVYYMLPVDQLSRELLENISAYLTLFLGLAYLLYGYWFSKCKQLCRLTWFYYFFGTLTTLAGAYYFVWDLNLFGSPGVQSWIWVVAYPLLLFGLFYTSLQLNSKSMLGLSSFFLIVYINHFAWIVFSGALFGFAIIISGFTVIGISFGAYHLHKNYMVK